jgi:hypothetical protein
LLWRGGFKCKWGEVWELWRGGWGKRGGDGVRFVGIREGVVSEGGGVWVSLVFRDNLLPPQIFAGVEELIFSVRVVTHAMRQIEIVSLKKG